MDYKDENMWLMLGDCLERLKELDDNSVDSIVTDPPYGLSFMGKHWDKGVPSAEIWAEALRVLKPGGHLLAFAGTRTQHRMAVNIEDAGFEIRDMIAWVYGTGFPKSHDIGKAIDKAAGAERKVVGLYDRRSIYDMGDRSSDGDTGGSQCAGRSSTVSVTAPATSDAARWDGWGTALKPALEPITVARKPFKGTVAANAMEHGTGAINIDGCRVGSEARPLMVRTETIVAATSMSGTSTGATSSGEMTKQGRFPANLIHDGSDEVVELFPVTAKKSAARFFYCAKASKKDRGEDNKHPTVKPTDLMRYLCRLVTPPNGIVLDPFMGSGSTGKAAMLEGFLFAGIELESEYFEIAKQRILGE